MQRPFPSTARNLIGMTDKLGFMRRLNLFEQMTEAEVGQISKELKMRRARPRRESWVEWRSGMASGGTHCGRRIISRCPPVLTSWSNRMPRRAHGSQSILPTSRASSHMTFIGAAVAGRYATSAFVGSQASTALVTMSRPPWKMAPGS
jgi:hypothetical protein